MCIYCSRQSERRNKERQPLVCKFRDWTCQERVKKVLLVDADARGEHGCKSWSRRAG